MAFHWKFGYENNFEWKVIYKRVFLAWIAENNFSSFSFLFKFFFMSNLDYKQTLNEDSILFLVYDVINNNDVTVVS